MQLLAVRNPRDWSGKQPQDLPDERKDQRTSPAVVDLFKAAYMELKKLGVSMPTDDDEPIALPPTQFRPVINGPGGSSGLPEIEDMSSLPPTKPRSLA